MKNYSLKAKLLYKLLMKERVLHLYIEEVLKQKPNNLIVKEFTRGTKNVMDFLDFFNDIDASLYWEKTTQGYYFWKKLYNKSYEFNVRYEELLLKR